MNEAIVESVIKKVSKIDAVVPYQFIKTDSNFGTESKLTVRSRQTKVTKIGAMFGVLSLAILFTMGVGLRNAHATGGLVCTDTNTSTNVLDESPVPLNAPISCVSSTDNASVTSHEVIITQNGATVSDTTGSGASASFSFTADKSGPWDVTVKYFAGALQVGQDEIVDFSVSFMVLPESPLGVAAITGSALAALGAFVGIRKRALAF